MMLEEIEFEKTEKGAREAIKKVLGNQVILRDRHNNLVHGFLPLNQDPDDVQCDKISIKDARGRETTLVS